MGNVLDSSSGSITLMNPATQMKHVVELGNSDTGCITRIDNVLNNLNENHAHYMRRLKDAQTKLESTKAVLDKPFIYEAELAAAQKELTAVNAELNIGKDNHADIVDEKSANDETGHKAVTEGVEIEAHEEDWEDEM